MLSYCMGSAATIQFSSRPASLAQHTRKNSTTILWVRLLRVRRGKLPRTVLEVLVWVATRMLYTSRLVTWISKSFNKSICASTPPVPWVIKWVYPATLPWGHLSITVSSWSEVLKCQSLFLSLWLCAKPRGSNRWALAPSTWRTCIARASYSRIWLSSRRKPMHRKSKCGYKRCRTIGILASVSRQRQVLTSSVCLRSQRT